MVIVLSGQEITKVEQTVWMMYHCCSQKDQTCFMAHIYDQ